MCTVHLQGFPGQADSQGLGEGSWLAHSSLEEFCLGGESDLGELRPLTVCLKAVKSVNFITHFCYNTKLITCRFLT